MEKIVCPYCGKAFTLAEAQAKQSGVLSEGKPEEEKKSAIKERLFSLKEHLQREQEQIILHLLALERKKTVQAATIARIDEAAALVDKDDRKQAEELLRSCGWELDP